MRATTNPADPGIDRVVRNAAGAAALIASYFPQTLRARAQPAEKQGKPDEARANLAPFDKLSGQAGRQP